MTSLDAGARWPLFAVISGIFFVISAGTFSSLGVVLPHMIEELGWSWSQAGTGFSLLALAVGLASVAPAWLMRRIGITATFAIGGGLMIVGFAVLALIANLPEYYIGATLLGIGYACCGIVPSLYLLNGWMPGQRSIAIGAYLTAGGLGAVAGPLGATGIMSWSNSWRTYWWVLGACMLLLTGLALIVVRTPPAAATQGADLSAGERERTSARVYRTPVDWEFRAALRTSQFWLVAAAMTTTLLCELTSNSWTTAHLGKLGLPATLAAAALSAVGAVSALSRAAGGALARLVDPKWLVAVALALQSLSMAALSSASGWALVAAFAVAEGMAFGLCMLATAILLVNYYGPRNNPEIFGTFNLITTAAMIGPLAGGLVADRFGSFGGLFKTYAVLQLGLFIALAAMRAPAPSTPGNGAPASH